MKTNYKSIRKSFNKYVKCLSEIHDMSYEEVYRLYLSTNKCISTTKTILSNK